MKCVVLDAGSGTTKASAPTRLSQFVHYRSALALTTLSKKVGYAGEDAPRCVFPSVTARSRGQDKTLYVGNQVFNAVPPRRRCLQTEPVGPSPTLTHTICLKHNTATFSLTLLPHLAAQRREAHPEIPHRAGDPGGPHFQGLQLARGALGPHTADRARHQPRGCRAGAHRRPDERRQGSGDGGPAEEVRRDRVRAARGQGPDDRGTTGALALLDRPDTGVCGGSRRWLLLCGGCRTTHPWEHRVWKSRGNLR